MKKILSLLLVAVMLVGMVSTLSGCGKKNADIRIYVGDQIYDFDPALAFVDDNASRILGLLFEPLFLLEEDGDVVPGLAEDYEIIEDEERGVYQMEITLKESYWNDGKAMVTADDIYFAWTRILDPEFPSQAAPLLYDIKNATSVKKGDGSRNDIGLEANKDVLTITFEGKIDYDAFLRNLTSVALTPLRENKVTEGDPAETYWAKRVSYITTNGPFAVRTWNRLTGEFTLQRNEYYHVSEPEEGNKTKDVLPAQITTKWTDENFRGNMNAFLEDTFANFASLEEVAENAIFCVGAMPLDKDLRLEHFDDAEIFDAFSTYSFIFNSNRAPFDNEKVRLALSMVIDREYLAEQIVFAKAADGLISPAVWDSVKKKTSFREESESLIATTANVEAARALLSGVDTSKTITLTVRETVEEMLIAEHAQEQWRLLGFNVKINYVTADVSIWNDEANKKKKDPGRTVDLAVGTDFTVCDDGIQAAYYSGEFDVLGLDYNMYSTNAFTALCGFSTTLNGNGVDFSFDEVTENSKATVLLHCSGFSDAAYDALIDRALAEKDLEARAAILHEAEAYLLSKMPIAPILYNQSYYLVDEIGSLDYDGYGNPVFNSARLKADIPEAPVNKDED